MPRASQRGEHGAPSLCAWGGLLKAPEHTLGGVGMARGSRYLRVWWVDQQQQQQRDHLRRRLELPCHSHGHQVALAATGHPLAQRGDGNLAAHDEGRGDRDHRAHRAWGGRRAAAGRIQAAVPASGREELTAEEDEARADEELVGDGIEEGAEVGLDAPA